MKGMPWWGWIIAAIIVVNVVNTSGNSTFPVVVLIMVAVAVLNRGKRKNQGQVGPTPAPPSNTPRPIGGPYDEPQDDVTSRPLPRIDVPEYPNSPTTSNTGSGLTTGSASTSGTSNDPVISLAQLHLSRLGRELHEAASRAAVVDVTRLLTEIGELATRMTTMLAGTHGLPGSGRKEFESGLRRLDREVAAAHSEKQPGPKVSRVVQTCRSMGQNGRYE